MAKIRQISEEKGKGGVLTIHYIRQTFYKPAQTYIICILISLAPGMGI